ncbi:MAG: hypothetical protein KY442_13080, partial [Proteobacteria bacterium]|nr:hypothetical protein [Pseudomonadota bacterium]
PVVLVAAQPDLLECLGIAAFGPMPLPTVNLHASSDHLFFMNESATDFEFARASNGQVTGMKIIWDGTRSELAKRLR